MVDCLDGECSIMMLHMYAIVLAVVLLIGALAAIIVCVCVDIVPIIKSRGSTLMSRDSTTQEQARMLKKSLQRSKLTSSASVDFIDSVHGRKLKGQRKSRPRYASTPLTLLSGEEEKAEEPGYKTTVIMEALPKKSTSDVAKDPNDDVPVKPDDNFETKDAPVSESRNMIATRYEIRSEMGKRSGSTPNVATRRSNSMELLDQKKENARDSMTFNSRDPRFYATESKSGGFPSPQVALRVSSRDISENGIGSTLHSDYAKMLKKSTDSHDANFIAKPILSMPDFGMSHCERCEMERVEHGPNHDRYLAYSRDETYRETKSPRTKPRHMFRQHSLEEYERSKHPEGFPYDRNKYCKNPHRGYSPCPDCFHNSHSYYTYGYHSEIASQSDFLNQGLSLKTSTQGIVPQMISTSSSSTSSSGSSTRFRHIRQPLEDIQEDTSDCYALRDAGATSTIDSRDLESGADDGTIPQSSDNSDASISPIIVSESQTPVLANTAT